jgi:hypothetical protein
MSLFSPSPAPVMAPPPTPAPPGPPPAFGMVQGQKPGTKKGMAGLASFLGTGMIGNAPAASGSMAGAKTLLGT